MSKELEALEKKFPDDGNGDDDAYNKGWNDCRERVLALLTTRQEVAPVADGAALLVRDVCEMAPADPDAPDTVCIRVADLTRIAELYTTTGQTSDARDAARSDESIDAAMRQEGGNG